MTAKRLAFLICVQLVFAVGCGIASRPVSLPDLGRITNATANLQGETLGHGDAKFELDMDVLERVLFAIAPAKQCKANIANGPIVTIELVLADGKRQTIKIFDTGQNALTFTMDDCWCVRSGAYERKNRLTGESTAFYPNEAINVYNYLRTKEKSG